MPLPWQPFSRRGQKASLHSSCLASVLRPSGVSSWDGHSVEKRQSQFSFWNVCRPMWAVSSSFGSVSTGHQEWCWQTRTGPIVQVRLGSLCLRGLCSRGIPTARPSFNLSDSSCVQTYRKDTQKNPCITQNTHKSNHNCLIVRWRIFEFEKSTTSGRRKSPLDPKKRCD